MMKYGLICIAIIVVLASGIYIYQSDIFRNSPDAASSTPTSASSLTESERTALVEYALDLINQARIDSGLNAVNLDDNSAAQAHAEDMRVNCTRGHWGTDGTKPYMRYTLAGGEQYSAENVFAIDFCPDDLSGYAIESPAEQIDYAMTQFLNSPGHRRNMLDPHHRKVGIGLTYRSPTIWFVQLFVGDYVEYGTKPTINARTLMLSGRVKNGAEVSEGTSTLTIYYDPPLEPLTPGQLSRTYCYNNGQRVASVRPPAEAGSAYIQNESAIEVTASRCPDPYDIPSASPSPTSNDEARQNWQSARDFSRTESTRQVTIPLITADEWSPSNDEFDISADISELLAQYGDGIYTMLLWGVIDGESTPISEYSIFVPSVH